MNDTIARIILYVLVVVHLFLGLWAIAGWIEWFVPDVFWSRISNPLFDKTMLFIHWSAILVASLLFLISFILRSKYVPVLMTIIYSIMALLCAVQTFFYLESESRYLAMLLEYTAYGLILFLLWRITFFRNYFSY